MPQFDPSQPYEVMDEPKPRFDPTKPFESLPSRQIAVKPEPVYGEPGGETVTETEMADIEQQAESLFPTREPVEPGRERSSDIRSLRDLGRATVNRILHPLKMT